jgi:hypothetical protein
MTTLMQTWASLSGVFALAVAVLAIVEMAAWAADRLRK